MASSPLCRSNKAMRIRLQALLTPFTNRTLGLPTACLPATQYLPSLRHCPEAGCLAAHQALLGACRSCAWLWRAHWLLCCLTAQRSAGSRPPCCSQMLLLAWQTLQLCCLPCPPHSHRSVCPQGRRVPGLLAIHWVSFPAEMLIKACCQHGLHSWCKDARSSHIKA